MDIAIFQGLIGNVGFPIAVCMALFWSNRETVKHYERILIEFKRTIDDNTQAMNSLCDRIKKG